MSYVDNNEVVPGTVSGTRYQVPYQYHYLYDTSCTVTPVPGYQLSRSILVEPDNGTMYQVLGKSSCGHFALTNILIWDKIS